LGLVARLGEERSVDTHAREGGAEEERDGARARSPPREGPSDEAAPEKVEAAARVDGEREHLREREALLRPKGGHVEADRERDRDEDRNEGGREDRKSTRLNS